MHIRMYLTFLSTDGKNQIISYPMGRELFMAPEALKDLSEIGFPNDIWSMGVILFILLVS